MIQATIALRKITGIYKITSPKGRVYIGQSKDIVNRFRSYKRLDCKGQIRLYRSLIKYGVSNHNFEVIEVCVVNELNNRERHWQEKFKCITKGLNCSLVSTTEKKFEHSIASIKKISKSRKGIVFSDEHKENIRKVRTGTTLKESTKLKLRDASLKAGCKPPSWKGKIKTKKHLENISASLKGRIKSREENVLTSNSMLNKVLPYSSVVINVENGVFYYSIRDAARSLKMNVSILNKHLKRGVYKKLTIA